VDSAVEASRLSYFGGSLSGALPALGAARHGKWKLHVRRDNDGKLELVALCNLHEMSAKDSTAGNFSRIYWNCVRGSLRGTARPRLADQTFLPVPVSGRGPKQQGSPSSNLQSWAPS